ncbi:hypothetical protein GCM10025867_19400 [Frondihabitans sucicola]|uniref:Uncharacterized protein n=1 Tax=Frondihabitans sucicola TaxID=1268041 RepID=A0ABN6XXI9_9MICO|nr:hypothetical protein GCM10025867_19400 [Frondihabitans sucicola]
MHYRLSNEYEAEWPFWSLESQCPDGDPALPAWLDAEVRAWAEDFNEKFSDESGWATERAAEDHQRRAKELLRRVRRVVESNGDTVELHYWETSRRKGF